MVRKTIKDSRCHKSSMLCPGICLFHLSLSSSATHLPCASFFNNADYSLPFVCYIFVVIILEEAAVTTDRFWYITLFFLIHLTSAIDWNIKSKITFYISEWLNSELNFSSTKNIFGNLNYNILCISLKKLRM